MNNSLVNAKLNESEYLENYDDFNESNPTIVAEERHWEKMFHLLVEFKGTHGHCLGPLNHTENIFLWKWIEGQRKDQHTLDAERKKRLDELGFVWTNYDITWEKNYLNLCKFKNNTGHCNVPCRYKDNLILGSWVLVQRTRKGSLRADRKKKLDNIGFIWDSYGKLWEDNFLKLIDFKNKYGHCNVTKTLSDDHSLALWVCNQRAKSKTLSNERKNKLNKLGFDWDVFDTAWEIKFTKLIEFKNKNGNFIIIKSTDSEFSAWLTKQRKNRFKLSSGKRKKLDAINFNWEPRLQGWEKVFQRLLIFKHFHGHCEVSRNFSDAILANWVHKQRNTKINLDTIRIQKLDEIEFTWSCIEKKVA